MIKTELVGGDAAIARLRGLPDRVRDELKYGIGRVALKLTREVQQNKLSGQVLGVRTGRLRRSINNVVEDRGDVIAGTVSSPLKYAAFHEYGFTGEESVRAHLRRSKEQFSLRKLKKDGGETAASKRRGQRTGEIEVRAFTRHVNYPEHSFLRSALRELEASGFLASEIDAALARAAKG